MEFNPGQYQNRLETKGIHIPEDEESLDFTGTQDIETKNMEMRPEVLEILKQLEASEKTYQEELMNFQSNDVDVKKNAWEYLEPMHANLVSWKNRFDVYLGYPKKTEAEVRDRVEERRLELFKLLGNETEQ